jgi:hypothetical protein
MSLDAILAGARILIDANVFIYAKRALSAQCRRLLERSAQYRALVQQPSPGDADVTRQLKAAGECVGIPLLDHIISIEAGSSASWRQENCERIARALHPERFPEANSADALACPGSSAYRLNQGCRV